MESTRRDVVIAVALSAALVGAMEGVYRPGGSEGRVRARLAQMSRDLDLTTEQAREIEEILREQADAEAAGAASEGRDDPRATRRAFRDRIAAVLTEEQRERLRRLRAERGCRPREEF
jgi:Spy/CpxP family protein refolding chaperone